MAKWEAKIALTFSAVVSFFFLVEIETGDTAIH